MTKCPRALRRTLLPFLVLAAAAPAPATAVQPVVPTPGRVLNFDLAGVEVGVAHYEEGPTGATVFHFPKPVMVAVDVRGGAPGTINTDALRLAYDEPFVDAITIAAGSSYGLSVATGVAEALKDRRADAGEWGNIATVAGAIIFDLGPRRFTTVTPDAALGRAALNAARPGVFPLGAVGAGRFATQGGYFDRRTYSGQGAAVRQLGTAKVAVFTVVNSLGSVVDRTGRVVRCAGAAPDQCGGIDQAIAAKLATTSETLSRAGPTANTTITLVLTNEKLPFWALQRLAVQVHSSLGRSIQPYSTSNDGDVLFAATTAEVDNPDLSVDVLGLLASEAAWDAVLASVPALDAAPAQGRQPSRAELASYAGRYQFAPGAEATVEVRGNELWVTGPTRASLYLPKEAVRLHPVGPADFRIEGPRADRLRFEVAGGRVTGLTVNPGHWPVPARRISAPR